MAVSADMKTLFEAGVHFGHKTSRWHPKMAPYIHSKRLDSHIINLERTVEALDKALPFLSSVATSGKQVLLVGTKKQAKEAVRAAADRSNQPFVTERWIGGMLTNSATVNQQIKKLKDIERRMESGELEKRYSKLEVQRFQEEADLLNLKYGGIKNLNGRPGALFVTDVITDANAVKEANTLGIPVVAIVDTNANPAGVDYVIPGNDDAIRSIEQILDYVVQAVTEGAGAVKPADAPKAKKEEVEK